MIFRTPELEKIETDVLAEIDKVRSDIRYSSRAPARWLGTVRRAVFARAVRGSNSIEGYNVTEEDAIAAAEGERPASTSEETWMAISGYRQAMNVRAAIGERQTFLPQRRTHKKPALYDDATRIEETSRHVSSGRDLR